ncbi:MAG: 50S ribosomal protein L32 [Phototrophicales bacterium]|nr:MAG: 50S ribosomal protein L32 [Phototrophicales bacterium]
MGPLPKRKVSRRRRGNRRSHDSLVPPHLVKCEECDNYKPSHQVCPHCGTYKGTEVIAIEDEE